MPVLENACLPSIIGPGEHRTPDQSRVAEIFSLPTALKQRLYVTMLASTITRPTGASGIRRVDR